MKEMHKKKVPRWVCSPPWMLMLMWNVTGGNVSRGGETLLHPHTEKKNVGIPSVGNTAVSLGAE
uniref:Uncharacterized protein n=1 Tax=Anguilla anguilla TaxID=7936 RepID=A0A0E9RUM8_ANGAN